VVSGYPHHTPEVSHRVLTKMQHACGRLFLSPLQHYSVLLQLCELNLGTQCRACQQKTCRWRARCSHNTFASHVLFDLSMGHVHQCRSLEPMAILLWHEWHWYYQCRSVSAAVACCCRRRFRLWACHPTARASQYYTISLSCPTIVGASGAGGWGASFKLAQETTR
jgi:hypothetical protein